MDLQKRAKFGFLPYDAMIENLKGETDLKKKLDAYDINFTPDTKECYVISTDLTPYPIKSKVYVYDSVESAVEQLNINIDTYAGQIVAVQVNEKYYGYIVNPASGGWSITPLCDHIGKIDYDTLGNRPIKNLYGEMGNPVTVSDLNDGVYIINGQYQISPSVPTLFSSSANNIFVVSKDDTGTYINRISAKDVTKYSIAGDIVTESRTVTIDFLTENGYVTTDYVNEQIAALEIVTKNDLDKYITNTLLENLESIIDQKIDIALDECLIVASDADIEALFPITE